MDFKKIVGILLKDPRTCDSVEARGSLSLRDLPGRLSTLNPKP